MRIATSLPVRLLVTTGLLAAIALTIDWGQVADRLAAGEWGWFAGAVGVLFASLAVGAVRWQRLLRAAGLPVSGWQGARAYWIGLFANNFLPTGFGGDAARAILVARGGPALARSFTSVFVDRASSIACLMAVGLVAAAVSTDAVPSELGALLVAVSVAAAIATAAAVAALRVANLGRWLPERVRPWAREVRATLAAYTRDRGLIAVVVALGVGFQLLVVVSFWMLARSLGLDLELALLAVVLPLVLVAMLLPVSIAGFGVREGGFVVLLDTAGVSAADATLLSLLSVVALAVASSPGAFAMLTSGRREALPEGAPQGLQP